MLLRKNRTVLIAALALIVLTIGGLLLIPFLQYKATINEISIDHVDLASIEDGQYTGEFDAQLVKAKVLVTMKDHRIVSIELVEHHNGRGESANTIPDTIVQEQRIDVDSISGATSSSKVIMKAVENALTKHD